MDIKSKNFVSITGPESGFSDSEYNLIEENNFKVRLLGNNILRAETAPIVIASLVQNHFDKISLSGERFILIGGAGFIGHHLALNLKKYGAEVVLLDINKKKILEMQNKVNDLCIYCDVTNKKSVKDAFKKISRTYGGVDILISNAGTAIGGSIAEVDENILRKSFEENFFSHQNCASEAVKIMKKQNINGCLLFNISKQSVNPGKNFGPYGLPKSALLGLCKQYALDYGNLGIRSNGVKAMLGPR